MNRRTMLQMAGSAAVASVGVLGTKSEAIAQTYSGATRGMPALKITNVKTIMTCPEGGNYVVVKVETSEPGLYGVGSATLTTRGAAVATAISEFLAPFAMGKDPAFIEDMWQTAYVSSYWRNGPILNGALCGLDEALWDIKAKRANMPLYDLLGGKSRFALTTYCHADGKTIEQSRTTSVNSWNRAGSMCAFSWEVRFAARSRQTRISKLKDSAGQKTSPE